MPKVTVENVDRVLESRTSLSVPMSLVLCLQYSLAPFFGFPHKLAFHYFLGASYETSLQHFKRDHRTATNLFLHLACLIVQIGANFAFIAAVDEAMRPVIGSSRHTWSGGIKSPLSTCSAVSWGLYLACTPAPPLVRILALASLYTGFASADLALRHWEMLSIFAGLITACVLKYHRFYSYTHKLPLTAILLLRFMPHFALVYDFSLREFSTSNLSAVRAVLAPYIWQLNCLVSIILLSLSHRPFRKRPNCFFFGTIGWLFALVTNQPAFLFLSMGFLGSSMQGCAHKYTKELPTLPQLDANVANELGHTTYFPCLLIQAVLESPP